MKTNKLIMSAMMALTLGGVMTSCNDFDDINNSPLTTGGDKIKPYYSLLSSIKGAQMDPYIGERLFVIEWASAARQDGEDGYNTSIGKTNDGWYGDAFRYISNWMRDANTCIRLIEEPQGTWTAHEKDFYPNLKQMARIWRVQMMAQFVDNFGPAPLNGFQGVNPEFSSEKDVYYWMLAELADAVSNINTEVAPNDDEKKNDPVFAFDAAKWKNYGISLRMRLAMRLSEADPAKAKSEFEAAVAQGSGIKTVDGTAAVQEYDGWSDWSGPMSRSWDIQSMSATMANLTTNFGGTASVDALAKYVKNTNKEEEGKENENRYAEHVKDASTYLGLKFDQHWEPNTDNPTKQFFFDGLPSKVDPRALLYYFLPGDYKNRTQTGYVSYFTNPKAPQVEKLWAKDDQNKTALATVDATYCWNGLTAGYSGDEKATTNGLVSGSDLGGYGYIGTYPSLADEYRNSKNKRFFFGPWETYFLLAEAAERGWNVGTTAEAAYYAGIKASFEYNGIEDLYDAYIASEDYNRVGTSVKWSHTTEPTATSMTFKNGYTGAEETVTYEYPKAANTLYAKVAQTPALNDHLTKIITQLYIANTPYLPQENWSNHRRLGLPFWEIPTSTMSITDMKDWTKDSYKSVQSISLFVQRFKYPSSLSSSDAAGYEKAVSFLKGGVDSNLTPLWWAIGGH
jgi:hypothetical protein